MAITKIRGLTQIKEKSIYDINIADDANIKTSKLEDGYRIAFLDGSRVFTGDLNLGGHRITNLADAIHPSDAVTKRQLDTFAQGLDVRESCKAATTGPITLSGLQSIDGVILQEGDRVLVKDQENKAENGIYIAKETDWVRAPDFDEPDDIDPGIFVFVEDGEKYKGAGFVLISPKPSVVGQDPIEWTQFTGLGQVTAGLGLWKDGNYIAVGEGLGIYCTEDAVNIKLADDALKVDENGLTINEKGVKTKHIDDYAITGIKLNPEIAGPGITITSENVLAVNPDNQTIEVASDVVKVKDGGIDTRHIADGAITIAKIDDNVAGNGLIKDINGLHVSVDENIFSIVSDKITIEDGKIAYSKLETASPAQILVANENGVLSAVTVHGDAEIDITGKVTLPPNVLKAENYVVREVPIGDVDGQNTVFELQNEPVEGTVMVFVNGILMDEGETNDYTISGRIITFTFAPQTGDKIRVTYFKKS